ncbi:MAG: MoxR family ATPase [Candidatus Eisenbacteria bacterium]
MSVDAGRATERVTRAGERMQLIRAEIGRVIVGQEGLIQRLLIGLLADGHLLLEGVPGLAKTLAVRTLANSLSLSFKRIQFTPDLLPADLTGTLVFNPRDGSFSAKRGPVFANLVLADEINRAPAKVQSALLEAMQERQVTIGEETHRLEQPFLVLATQNPIEQEGTYALPEAQSDRFMMKIKVDYPTREEEKEILKRIGMGHEPPAAHPVAGREEILSARAAMEEVYVDEKIQDYVLDVVQATRDPKRYGLDLKHLIAYGASPRATLFLVQAARGHALLDGRAYVTPEDVKAIALDVLRHRIHVTYEAEAEEISGEEIARRVLEKVRVP